MTLSISIHLLRVAVRLKFQYEHRRKRQLEDALVGGYNPHSTGFDEGKLAAWQDPFGEIGINPVPLLSRNVEGCAVGSEVGFSI